MGELTPQEFAILDFEATDWGKVGNKESMIGQMLGLSPTVYYARLNALLDDERAVRDYPIMVNRLRRLRSAQPGRERDRSEWQ